MATRAIQVQDVADPDKTYVVQLAAVTALKHNKSDNSIWFIGAGFEVLVPMTLGDAMTLLGWRADAKASGRSAGFLGGHLGGSR